MRSGATSSVGWPRWKVVPVTASSPSLSRTRWAISSKPTLSGNFLGSLCLVALPPAQAGIAGDLFLKLDDRVDQGLGPRRAAGHVDVDRQELVGARHHRVVVEHPRARGAGAHRDHPLGLEHLVVDAPDDRRHLDRHATGEDQQIGLPGREAHHLGAESGQIVSRRSEHRDHLDPAAGQAEAERPDRVAPCPGLRLLQAGQHHPLLHVLLQGLALEVTPEQLLRLELADAEVAVELLPRYFHSSAPLRQTKASATSRSPTNTAVSTSANAPKALSWRATG